MTSASESNESDARLARVLRVLDKWGIDPHDESSTLDAGDDFAEAIREDGAWRFVRDMRSTFVIPPEEQAHGRIVLWREGDVDEDGNVRPRYTSDPIPSPGEDSLS